MDLLDVLDNDQRVIVLSHKHHGFGQDDLIYTWNKSMTFQCFYRSYSGDWRELNVMTVEEVPVSFEAAQAKAQSWHAAYMGD